jgi:hypothetical protein
MKKLKSFFFHIRLLWEYYRLYRDRAIREVELREELIQHVDEYLAREREKLLNNANQVDVIFGKVPSLNRSDRVAMAAFDLERLWRIEHPEAVKNGG